MATGNDNGFSDPLRARSNEAGGTSSATPEELLRQWKALENIFGELVVAAEQGRKQFEAMAEQLGELRGEIQQLRSEGREIRLLLKMLLDGQGRSEVLLREVMVPSAELISKLRNRDVDEYILKTMVLAIAHIVDRQGSESKEKQQEMIFSYFEHCRELDREEHLNLLALFDIEQFGCRVGSKLDPRHHAVKKFRVTDQAQKIGRIISMLRPGYRRKADGWVVRPASVEAWAAPAVNLD